MANFKLNLTEGRCDFCGRKDRGHCTVSYPRVPERQYSGTRRIRICKECGTLIFKVVVTKEDYKRNRHFEKKMKTIVKERKAKRKEQR